MSTPLLRTKLYIPPVRPGLVSRPRLVERLDAGIRRGCKLTLISAPPGSAHLYCTAGTSETTLLREWVHQADVPAAWVSLTRDSNHTAFLHCIPAGAFDEI